MPAQNGGILDEFSGFFSRSTAYGWPRGGMLTRPNVPRALDPIAATGKTTGMPAEESKQDLSRFPDLFDPTQWSVVIRAGGDSPEAAKALEKLCRTYWPPLYAFARRDHLDEHSAQDAVQGFLARLLARRDIAGADPARGRFRAFLVGAFKNHLASLARRELAQKRGGGAPGISIEIAGAEGLCAPELVDTLTPDRAFDRSWARTLMARALSRLRAEHATPQQAKLFSALEPVLSGGGRLEDTAALSAQLGTTPAALATAATRLRRRYRELIEDEVTRTLENPADLGSEMRALREVWA
jgi:RNA polymerase sigma-70 factor (ECF subfamily)